MKEYVVGDNGGIYSNALAEQFGWIQRKNQIQSVVEAIRNTSFKVVVLGCYLTSKFGTKYHPARWESHNIFYLAKHIDIDTFLRLEHRSLVLSFILNSCVRVLSKNDIIFLT
jgi:hypothetical protein